MITLIVSWACVYSWEPMGDSWFGLNWRLTTMVLLLFSIGWCYTAQNSNVHYRLSSYSNMTSGFLDLCWLLCIIMVVVGDQALDGRLSISNHQTGSTVVGVYEWGVSVVSVCMGGGEWGGWVWCRCVWAGVSEVSWVWCRCVWAGGEWDVWVWCRCVWAGVSEVSVCMGGGEWGVWVWCWCVWIRIIKKSLWIILQKSANGTTHLEG